MREKLIREYVEWMCGLVSDRKYTKGASYGKLFCLLYHTEFTYTIDMDGNREEDGVDLRYRFGDESGLKWNVVASCLDDRPCSVLEMMVALAVRLEEHIMDNPDIGNRTGQWFWGMIANLGLRKMTDEHFDSSYVKQALDRFLNREYERNGAGGLFTVSYGNRNMKAAEIWLQAMWYLDEVLKN